MSGDQREDFFFPKKYLYYIITNLIQVIKRQEIWKKGRKPGNFSGSCQEMQFLITII